MIKTRVLFLGLLIACLGSEVCSALSVLIQTSATVPGAVCPKGVTSSASPGDLLKVQSPRPCPRTTNSAWGLRAQEHAFLPSSQGDSEGQSSRGF